MASAPNILWIVTTQWRGQAAGFAGDANARTPELDRLASQSTWYRQAVTPHPFGPFARAALLTGVPSPQNGVVDYFDPLPRGARTIAHKLGERGYRTAFFGKWHLGDRDRAAPLVGEAHARMIVPAEARGGFDFWEGFESGFLLNDPWLHGSRLPQPAKFAGYQSDVVCTRAAEYLAGPDGEPTEGSGLPWFSIVSLEATHPPYDAPAAGVKPRAPQEVKLARNVPLGDSVEVKARAELAGYYAHIEATDRAIGRLISAVDAAAARQGTSTFVVFTSVHGDMHGAHGLFRKGWPHEESIRVPLLLRNPAGGERKISDALVSLSDLADMAVEWASGVETHVCHSPDRVQRISMPSIVALPHQCDRRWRGVRTTSRKIILNDDGSPWLFFDLERDPLELKNLAAEPSAQTEIEALRGLV